jgi:hypothetical protein
MKKITAALYCFFQCCSAFSQAQEKTAVLDTISSIATMHTFNQPFTKDIHRAIPSDFYAKHMGFFCRQELKMQQVHIPVTFRLGSMEQCNYIEQKPGYKEKAAP